MKVWFSCFTTKVHSFLPNKQRYRGSEVTVWSSSINIICKLSRTVSIGPMVQEKPLRACPESGVSAVVEGEIGRSGGGAGWTSRDAAIPRWPFERAISNRYNNTQESLESVQWMIRYHYVCVGRPASVPSWSGESDVPVAAPGERGKIQQYRQDKSNGRYHVDKTQPKNGWNRPVGRGESTILCAGRPASVRCSGPTKLRN